MNVRKLHEANELEKRSKHHKKNNKGLSFYCTLNPDAGDVEHNVAMFNHMNTPAESPSVNPCGPMAEDINLREESNMGSQIELHYDDLEVTIVTRPQRPSSYHFEYDRDEAQTVEEQIEYEFTVAKSEIVDFLYENMTENDYADIDTAPEAEVLDFINKNFDALFAKYESMILDAYREQARSDAEEHMNESLKTEKFVSKLGADLHEAFLDKEIDGNTSEELARLEALYEKYAKAHDTAHMKKIEEKVRSAIASCADAKPVLTESTGEYVIMAVCQDGKKQYYNVSAVPHWVDKGSDATIFDDMDEARAVWFKLDKKSFKRVFIPNYDHNTMNEAITPVDVDRQYALDNLLDSIDDLMSWGLCGYRTRYIGNHVYRVEHRTGNTSVIVKFDISDPSKKFVFTIDKKGPYTATAENAAAKIIIDAVDNKHSKSFDMFDEDLSDRIRKNDLDHNDDMTVFSAEEDGIEIQLQDRETHTHEFRTEKNRWGRSYVAGQYNKQPKVASNTWGRVWKDGELVKQFEGPKYKVRADMAKYLDAEGKLDESKVPDNWTQYKGAWMYPVYGGWEANLDGLHYDAETEDELKAKIDRAVSGGYTKTDKLAALHNDSSKLPPYGGMLDEDAQLDDISEEALHEGAARYQVIVDAATPDYVVSEHEFLRDAIESAKEEIAMSWASNVRIKDLSDESCWHDVENAEADLRDGIVKEGWNPNLIDCPACGDISFDSVRGRCTQCSYHEDLNEANYGGAFDIDPEQYFTREDLVEFATSVTDCIAAREDALFDVCELYIEGNNITLGLNNAARNGEFEHYVTFRVDMRKIRYPHDLSKYTAQIADQFIAEYHKQTSLEEATAVLDRPLSGLDGTLSSVLLAHKDEVDTLLDKRAAIEFLDRIMPEVKNKSYVERVKRELIVSKRSPVEYFYNIILKGDGDGTDKGGKLSKKAQVRKWAKEELTESSDNYYEYKGYTITFANNGECSVISPEGKHLRGNMADAEAREFIDSMNESFLDDDNYEYISSKSVQDSDGFYTDYTWYKRNDGVNVFVFGDRDIYKPADGYTDHEEENDDAAQEWFDSYNGFEEDIVEGVNEQSVKYPNGMPVTDVDLEKALDYMYGTDRNPEWTYTNDEMQRAIYRWMDKVDPRPDGKSYMNLNESYNIQFYQIFEAPKSPTENGKMVGQRGSLSAAIDFGEDRCGKGNFIIKGVCDDGRTRYVDFYRKDRGYTPFAEYKDDIHESIDDPEDWSYSVYSNDTLEADEFWSVSDALEYIHSNGGNIIKIVKNGAETVIWKDGKAVGSGFIGKSIDADGNDVHFEDGEDVPTHAAPEPFNPRKWLYGESKESKPLYIIRDSHGNQLSAPNPDDEELWDRVASMEARGKRGLCVVAYTGKKESLKEWGEFSDDDVEDDLTHAAVYGGDSKYCKECGAVKQYDEDGFAYCPECCGELDESYWYNDPELRSKQDQLIAELEADGFEETDGQAHGTKHWTFFRKRIDGKGVWKAVFVDTGSNEAAIIDVTYSQVRGYEPLDSMDALRKGLGRALLPN